MKRIEDCQTFEDMERHFESYGQPIDYAWKKAFDAAYAQPLDSRKRLLSLVIAVHAIALLKASPATVPFEAFEVKRWK